MCTKTALVVVYARLPVENAQRISLSTEAVGLVSRIVQRAAVGAIQALEILTNVRNLNARLAVLCQSVTIATEAVEGPCVISTQLFTAVRHTTGALVDI